ncbi:hypothetical protein NIES4071_102840 (plasmid) [Calothrix sp. NIES-4071]|nr:hypothetical protein NIES4071_102840 [Calothrix sp. NIES-4071]BAZ64665.1 hypothetical protein NIES4105_103980 [Calothrix sp. NIES-4105]
MLLVPLYLRYSEVLSRKKKILTTQTATVMPMEPCDISLGFWQLSCLYGWDCVPDFNTDALVVKTTSYEFAKYILDNFREVLRAWASRFELSFVVIKYGNSSWDFIDIETKVSKSSILRHKFTSNPFLAAKLSQVHHMQSRNNLIDIYGADYVGILDFLKESRLQGRIVVITSNTTNICYHTNDLLLPSRGILMPYQWVGFDYSALWRNSRGGISQLENLQQILASDRYIEGYDYNLRRPDGAIVEYQTDYYLCRGFLGDEVRIGVSLPEDYRILEEAPEPALN